MRAAGYYRPSAADARAEQAALLDIERYCSEGFHTLTRTFGPGDPPLRDPDQFAGLVSYLESLGRGEALVVIPGPRHLSPTLDGLVGRLTELDRAGGEVRCTDTRRPDPLQNALESLPFAGRSPAQSLRVRESLLTKAARGEVLGRTPYGYVADIDGSFRIEPGEAALVRRLFDLYAGATPPEGQEPEGGPGLRLISGMFNAEGLRTRSNRPWTPVTLSGMLQNRAYTGSYARYGMRIVGNHDRIIERDVFNRAQSVMASRSPVRQRRSLTPYLLSGLARCWSCGRGMRGQERRRRWNRADGSSITRAYRYYACPSRSVGVAAGEDREAGAHPGWRAAELDRATLEAVRSEPVENLRASFRAVSDGAEGDDIRSVEDRFLEAVREVASGRGRVSDLAAPLGALRTAQDMLRTGSGAFTFDDAVRSLETAELSELHIGIASLVDRIIVYEDRVEPVFRSGQS